MTAKPTGAQGANAARTAARMMQQFDTNKDGSLDKAEFTAGLAAKGVPADEAARRFDSIDSKGSGKITQGDIEAAIKAGAGKATRPAGGAREGGHARGGGGAHGAEQSSAGSSTTTYEAADTNKDGTVSATEEMLYSMTHSDATAASGGTATRYKAGSLIDVSA
jgi:Ca2+-binding EF-hand superfamily protein